MCAHILTTIVHIDRAVLSVQYQLILFIAINYVKHDNNNYSFEKLKLTTIALSQNKLVTCRLFIVIIVAK